MFVFELIFLSYCQRLSFDEFQSFNNELSLFEKGKTKREDFEEILYKFNKDDDENDEQNSYEYSLIVKGVGQKRNSFDFQPVVDHNSKGKYYALFPQSKKLELSYEFPNARHLKKIKLNIPENLSQTNECNWINNFKMDIMISNKKYDFVNEFDAQKFKEIKSFSIESIFPELPDDKIICFGDLETED